MICSSRADNHNVVDLVAAALNGGVEAVEAGGVEEHAVAFGGVVMGLIADIAAGEGVAGGGEAIGDEFAGGFEFFPQPMEVF